jgi:2-polyprenyl-6-methoxyphenol hydroxylase-like FAD-dependent oxidoreductase
VAALRTLGIVGELERKGAVVRRFDHRLSDGTILARTPFVQVCDKLGVPSVAIHRSELQQVLLGALGDCPLTLGARCEQFEDDPAGGRVRVRFADGRDVEGDVLIGADGFHSAVRRHLVGPEEPREAGYVCWLATVPFQHPGMPSGYVGHYLGRGVRFGLLDIGHGRAYWFGTKNVGAEAARQGRVVKAEIRACFADAADEVQAVIDATPEAAIVSVPAMDRPPLKRWSRGRVTLLGDAAHPMLTSLSQGAGMAIEDAVVLGHCLAEASTVPHALERYEQLRRPRANRMVRMSRMLSHLEQLEHPIAAGLRNAYLRCTPARLWAGQYESVLRFSGPGLLQGSEHG